MILRILPCLLLVISGFWSFASYSLGMSDIPIFGNKATFSIELKNDKPLRALLEKELTQQRQTNRELKQFSKISKIARYERQLLNSRLRSEGYYAGQVKFSAKGEHITYRIEPGPIYHIQKLELELPTDVHIPSEIIGVKSGDILRAEAILASKKRLSDYIAANFCLYRISTDYRVVIEHQTHTAYVDFMVEDSPSVYFGDITFVGLNSIEEDYLRARLPIKKGECFKRSRIDSARLKLIQTNLLVSVNAEVQPPEENTVPITLRVVERHHRTVSAGIGFESDEGFGISTGWEHRNFMGRAQKLTIDSLIAKNTQTLSSKLILPHFRRNNQAVVLYTDLVRENTDAFDSKVGTVGAEISRLLKRNLRGLVGVELAFSSVKEDGVSDDYALLSLPLSLEYDKRSEPLDPRNGWVVSGRVNPYWDAYNTSTKFVKSTLAGSGYVSFEEFHGRPTLAVRGATGTISGIDRDQVPANVRFYSGGGGSVRGYPFQTLGPLTDNEPDGGLSFTEVSMEMRLRWGQSWGGVVFLDGGFAYEQETPNLGEDLLWGTGIGLRYYTSFAPIRMDIAVPIDKRENIDDGFQLYISIGQAF